MVAMMMEAIAAVSFFECSDSLLTALTSQIPFSSRLLCNSFTDLLPVVSPTEFEKQFIKQVKRSDIVAMYRPDDDTVLEKGLYYCQGNDFASELVCSISRLYEPCLERIDNNFNPLDAIQKDKLSDASGDIAYLIRQCHKKMENSEYNDFEEEIRRANDLNGQPSLLRRKELQCIQSQSGNIRTSMVYLTMVQETQNIVTYAISLMRVGREFQMEIEVP